MVIPLVLFGTLGELGSPGAFGGGTVGRPGAFGGGTVGRPGALGGEVEGIPGAEFCAKTGTPYERATKIVTQMISVIFFIPKHRPLLVPKAKKLFGSTGQGTSWI